MLSPLREGFESCGKQSSSFAAREIQPCPKVRGCGLDEIDDFRASRRDNLFAPVGGGQEHGFMMKMVIEISSTCLRARRLTTWISQKTFRSRLEAQVVRNTNVKSSQAPPTPAKAYILAHLSKPPHSDGIRTRFRDGLLSGDSLRLEHAGITGRRQHHPRPDAQSTVANDGPRDVLAILGNRTL